MAYGLGWLTHAGVPAADVPYGTRQRFQWPFCERATASDDQLRTLRVRHLMSIPAITVHAGATIQWAARQMVTRHIHRLVVVGDDGAPVGVVTPLDLLRTLIGEAEPNG